MNKYRRADIWKWVHYSIHAKKWRTRKKYKKKLRDHFAPHTPPGTRVEIGIIRSPWWSRTPYHVTIDVWELAKTPPAEIEMKLVTGGTEQ